MTAAVGTTKAFDALLVVHAVCAIAALAVLVTLRSAALGITRGEPRHELAARSFTGRPEVAGRVVHLVPLTGLAVVSVSSGRFSLTTGFVLVGLALWLVIAACLELVAFPAQREVATALAAAPASALAPAQRMARAVELALLALVGAAVVMIAVTTF